MKGVADKIVRGAVVTGNRRTVAAFAKGKAFPILFIQFGRCAAPGTPAFIHEIYYDDDGLIEKWTESPATPFGETPSELLGDLKNFMRAFEKPILTEKTENSEEAPGID